MFQRIILYIFTQKITFDFHEGDITYTSMTGANNSFSNQPPNTTIYQ